MGLRSFGKICLVLLALIYGVTTGLNPAEASKQKKVASLKLSVSKDTELYQPDPNHLVLREALGSSAYKCTVLNQGTLQVLRSYRVAVKGEGYDSWTTFQDNGRFLLIQRLTQAGSGQYNNSLLDLITGQLIQLPTTSVENQISLIPAGKSAPWGVMIWEPDALKVQELKTNKVRTIGHRGKPLGWNPQGEYLVYSERGLLQVYHYAKAEVTTIAGEFTGPNLFFTWAPDGKRVFYYDSGQLRIYGLTGQSQILAPFKPIFEGPLMESPSIVQWNPKKTIVTFQDQSQVIHWYDLTTNTYRSIPKPDQRVDTTYGGGLLDIYWNPQGTELKFLTDRRIGKMQWTNNNLYVPRQGVYQTVYLNGSAKFSYFKQYLLFQTDIEMMGSSDQFAHKLGVYDFTSGKLTLVDKISDYQLSPDGKRIIVYQDTGLGFAGQAYLLSERDWKVAGQIKGLKQGWLKVQNKAVYLVPGPKGSTLVYGCDLNTMKTTRLLSIGKNEAYQLHVDGQGAVFSFPWRKKLMMYNGQRVVEKRLNGTVAEIGSLAPRVLPDGRTYVYMEQVKQQYYLQLGRF